MGGRDRFCPSALPGPTAPLAGPPSSSEDATKWRRQGAESRSALVGRRVLFPSLSVVSRYLWGLAEASGCRGVVPFPASTAVQRCGAQLLLARVGLGGSDAGYFFVECCKPDVPCGCDRLVAVFPAIPYGGLEVLGTQRKCAFPPLGLQGLRQDGPPRGALLPVSRISTSWEGFALCWETNVPTGNSWDMRGGGVGPGAGPCLSI